jgi:hypothetical protein
MPKTRLVWAKNDPLGLLSTKVSLNLQLATNGWAKYGPDRILQSLSHYLDKYVGRTVNSLHKRMDGHRSKFYEIIDGRAVDITSNEYSLGVHLLDQGLGTHADFNDT